MGFNCALNSSSIIPLYEFMCEDRERERENRIKEKENLKVHLSLRLFLLGEN